MKVGDVVKHGSHSTSGIITHRAFNAVIEEFHYRVAWLEVGSPELAYLGEELILVPDALPESRELDDVERWLASV